MSRGDWIVLFLSIPISLVCGVVAGLAVEPLRRRYANWGKTIEQRLEQERVEIASYVNDSKKFTTYLIRTAIDLLCILFVAWAGSLFVVLTSLMLLIMKVGEHTITTFNRRFSLSYAFVGGILIMLAVALFIRKLQSFRDKWNQVKRYAAH